MERKPIIDLNSGEEVLLGTPGKGTSKWLEHILAEKGLSLSDVVVIDRETFSDNTSFVDAVKDACEKSNKLVFIENIDFLFDQFDILDGKNTQMNIDELPMPKSIEPHKIDVNSGHPFKKFMGKPNWKK